MKRPRSRRSAARATAPADAALAELQLVGCELHDGAVQLMTASLMHLETFAETLAADPDRALAELALAIEQSRQAVSETRRVIAGLLPPMLEEQGLGAAIQQLVNQARADVPRVTLAVQGDAARVPPAVAGSVYRIAQEALTNLRRHSGARRAKVSLAVDGRGLTLLVADDGRGFDPDAVPPERFGLKTMARRVELLDGEATLSSAPGRGTRLEVRLPLPVAR